MNECNRVSIVMAAYNEETNIENAIKSIQEQTYKNWELVIIDDGSTDGTAKLIDQFSNEDKRIKQFKNDKNYGLAVSLNKGIANSTGEFIARMDADDFSFPNRLSLQIEYMDKNPNVVVLGGGAIYTDSHKEVSVLMPEMHKEILKLIWKTSPFIHPSVIMRAAFIKKMGGYSESLRRAQDYDLWFRGRNSGRYHNLQEILLKYNCTQKRSIRSLYDSYRVRRTHSTNIKEFCLSFFWFLASICYRLVRS